MKNTNSGKMVRVADELHQRLVGLTQKTRRSITTEVAIAIENHLKKVSRKRA